ncbi:hypothetical protein [Pseudomonas sp. LP_7_YM]|uniref:hypothetical protein n=1 Tax=Pseudomonas sp. LP_7_YM TaxID=2485137 RepID=UPI001414CC6F|nr:hypothetical protein [Pseudomonas sp. LP_7_YM]
MSESTGSFKRLLVNDLFASILHKGRRPVRTHPGPAARYLGTIAVVALCGLLRAQMPSTALPYLFFIPGLMFCGFWFGAGAGAGAGASVLGCALAVLAAQYFFIGPKGFESDWFSWVNTFSLGLVWSGQPGNGHGLQPVPHTDAAHRIPIAGTGYRLAVPVRCASAGKCGIEPVHQCP